MLRLVESRLAVSAIEWGSNQVLLVPRLTTEKGSARCRFRFHISAVLNSARLFTSNIFSILSPRMTFVH
jgi:hypothetical protein